MIARNFISIFLINLIILLNLGILNGYEDTETAMGIFTWGNVNQTRRFHQQRFFNYPTPFASANGTGSYSSSNMIRGMRLTRLNNTDGTWRQVGGGLNHNFVNFEFRGSGLGRAYDFNLELFGTATTKSFSVILVALSSVIMFINHI